MKKLRVQTIVLALFYPEKPKVLLRNLLLQYSNLFEFYFFSTTCFLFFQGHLQEIFFGYHKADGYTC